MVGEHGPQVSKMGGKEACSSIRAKGGKTSSSPGQGNKEARKKKKVTSDQSHLYQKTQLFIKKRKMEPLLSGKGCLMGREEDGAHQGARDVKCLGNDPGFTVHTLKDSRDKRPCFSKGGGEDPAD